MRALPPRFARPLKGALPLDWQSQVHGNRPGMHHGGRDV